ncbi:shikimate dehydrogenase family protein [Neolewinella sp.]|uniref:shikimate dehydrogenase family protein n=1 Tax=Neolewinella sp. TaxID=2993543 RepID=UPI003B51C6F8
MATFGLIGYPLSHSFSRGYFTEKFQQLGLDDTHKYLNFELTNINQFKKILDEYSDLVGCNVTIPHKRAIMAVLDEVDPVAERIGAVNTILVRDRRTYGYNTDYLGFRDDLVHRMAEQGFSFARGRAALILGTGGASLAVAEAFRSLGVPYTFVSRKPAVGQLSYGAVTAEVLATHTLLVNTTPLGMYPRVDAAPDINYELLGPAHFCYDLIYNPAETTFMQRARGAGAQAANGLGMLHQQAEASWAIWTGE